ncbi:MAG TPA: DUF5615 family PIN-like protein [Bryobacteraceae bacterium]|jgi:predicted nuclease of predicted toxin-antitoxin system|nr:DUF5615 family PIN-like protein [Bryobacteraceae bacterium]
MNILVDENIPRMTVDALRLAGHDVKDVRGTNTEGSADQDLWEIACTERRLFVTTDKGFTEYRSTLHNGILVVRLRQPNRLKIHRSVLRALEHFGEDWVSRLVVVRDRIMSTSRATPTE